MFFATSSFPPPVSSFSIVCARKLLTRALAALWQYQSQAWIREEGHTNPLCCYTVLLNSNKPGRKTVAPFIVNIRCRELQPFIYTEVSFIYTEVSLIHTEVSLMYMEVSFSRKSHSSTLKFSSSKRKSRSSTRKSHSSTWKSHSPTRKSHSSIGKSQSSTRKSRSSTRKSHLHGSLTHLHGSLTHLHGSLTHLQGGIDYLYGGLDDPPDPRSLNGYALTVNSFRGSPRSHERYDFVSIFTTWPLTTYKRR